MSLERVFSPQFLSLETLFLLEYRFLKVVKLLEIALTVDLVDLPKGKEKEASISSMPQTSAI